MHDFSRQKHSVIGMSLLVAVIAVVIAAHIYSFNFLRTTDFNSTYIIPFAVMALGVIVFHIRKFKKSRAVASIPESEIVSRHGLHWHPEITIFVKGVKQAIPQTGITNMDMSKLHALHKTMATKHMHEGPNEQGVIHLKFEGAVQKSDIMLGKVFQKWGKDFRSYGSTVRMTVNGVENTEYENYMMRDNDKIELHYQ